MGEHKHAHQAELSGNSIRRLVFSLQGKNDEIIRIKEVSKHYGD